MRCTGSKTVRRGNVLPLVVLLTVFLVGMVAFALDTAYVAMTRTQMQRATDSGVLAGAEVFATWEGRPLNDAAAKAEMKKFVQLNESIELRDEDIRILRYDPTKAAGQRMSTTYSVANPPNAIEIIGRRDATKNGQLQLFFAPVIGQNKADVRVKSVGFIQPGKAVLPGVPMIPYTMHVNYYYAAVGQSLNGIDGQPIQTQDNWKVKADGTVISGDDGIKEVVLFGSSQNSPGNFGSVDIGSKSNGTPELIRQILHGPNYSDFHDPDFRDTLQKDGSLLPPFNVGGDPGLSTSVKDPFEQIIGKSRIVPLFDTVSGTGNNTSYHIVGFAAVVITDVDLQGNPKRVWVQPSKIITNKVVAGPLDTNLSEGVWTPPRMVIP